MKKLILYFILLNFSKSYRYYEFKGLGGFCNNKLHCIETKSK